MFNIELLQNLAKSKNKRKLNFITKIPTLEFKIESINFKNESFLKLNKIGTEIFNPKIIKDINNTENPFLPHLFYDKNIFEDKNDFIKLSFVEMQNEMSKQEELDKHQYEILRKEIFNRKKECDLLTSKIEIAEEYIENEKWKIIVIFDEKFNFGGDSAEYLSNKIINYAYNKELNNLKQELTKAREKFEPYKNWFQNQQQKSSNDISNQPSTSGYKQNSLKM